MSGALTQIAVGTFGGLSALPLRVADSQGFFRAAGLSIDLVVTRDSARLQDQLVRRELFVVHAAPDNVIAWTDAGPVPFRAWLAGSNGPITLVGREAVEVTNLRGARIAVDSPNGGFAPILRRLLAEAGITHDDVDLVPMGATRLRYSALLDARIDATMLTLPWSLKATENGAASLADHVSVAPGLLTSCAVSTADRLAAEPGTVAAYAEAIEIALGWLHEAEHGEEAAGLLASDMDLDVGEARSTLQVMSEPTAGWPAGARLHGAELVPTWQLRSETLGRPGQPPQGYVHVLESSSE